MRTVADFPNVLSLRQPDGRITGWFSDHGAWFGLTWGTRTLFEVRTFSPERSFVLHLGARATRTTVFADRLEAELENEARIRAGFASARALVIEYCGAQPPEVGCDLPFQIQASGVGRWLVVIAPDGGGIQDPDAFERNRARWNRLFERAWNVQGGLACPDGLDPATADRLLARALCTLMWNHRAPRGDIPHAGVIPSPFGYHGYWGWDSWKHAHALASIEPELAMEQLRAQAAHQRADGMLPDTVRVRRSDDNWDNTKPPLGAWALLAVHRVTGDRDSLREALPALRRWSQWWDQQRRLPGEDLFRCGGVDAKTAAWDSGWDDSHRFREIDLLPHDRWKLFDLWQADLNAYIYLELRCYVELLSEFVGFEAEVQALNSRADLQADRIEAELWDNDGRAYVDRVPSRQAFSGVISAAAWVPAWVGLGTPERRRALCRTMLDPDRFATPMPFPSLAASDPAFNPDDYWNGGVWLDHAAMALDFLGDSGSMLARRLLEHVDRQEHFYECYSPHTGTPCSGGRAALPQFSWSAAAVLEILRGGYSSGRSIR